MGSHAAIAARKSVSKASKEGRWDGLCSVALISAVCDRVVCTTRVGACVRMKAMCVCLQM